MTMAVTGAALSELPQRILPSGIFDRRGGVARLDEQHPANDTSAEVLCRACGGRGLAPVLDLGNLPLANALVTSAEAPVARYPLGLQLCPGCALVQLTHAVPPEKLFSDYVYFSSYSETMLRHVRSLVERMVVTESLGGSSRVIELASNDGYLLQYYRRAGIPVLGIEPAANVARVAAQERAIPTRVAFFTREYAAQLADEGLRADVLHAHNVLAHVPDLEGFVEGIATVLAPEGTAVIEVPHVVSMVDGVQFDTIYHEHHAYFSLTALVPLFARHGLSITDVERVEVHGGSLRVFAAPEGSRAVRPAVGRMLEEESLWGVRSLARYRQFGRRVRQLGEELRELIGSLKAQGRRVAAYGATAKGTVLMNCFGLDHTALDYVADRSPHKQGKFVPGARVPIVAPTALKDLRPDYLLLLAWNLRDEILAQQAEYRAAGGRFIVPVPEVEVLA